MKRSFRIFHFGGILCERFNKEHFVQLMVALHLRSNWLSLQDLETPSGHIDEINLRFGSDLVPPGPSTGEQAQALKALGNLSTSRSSQWNKPVIRERKCQVS